MLGSWREAAEMGERVPRIDKDVKQQLEFEVSSYAGVLQFIDGVAAAVGEGLNAEVSSSVRPLCFLALGLRLL